MQIWSGRPNEALTAEVAALAPGRALYVECGEGGEARWLAAPGGTLLITSHAGMEDRHRDFYRPDEIASRLDGSWQILVNENRTRVHPANGHVVDVSAR